jgi:hypothetical protein
MSHSRVAALLLATISVCALSTLGQLSPAADPKDSEAKKSEPGAKTKGRTSSPADAASSRREALRDLRKLVERKAGPVLESPVGGSEAETSVGIDERVLKYLASQSSARRLRPTTTREVLESAVDELTTRAHRSDLEGAVERPTSLESIVVSKWTLRPPLLTCSFNLKGNLPPLWFDKLNRAGTKKCIHTTLQAVGLLKFKDFEDNVIPVGTGWVVAPGVIMTNRHVAVTFAPCGKIMSNPDTKEPVPVWINFAAEECGGDPIEFKVTKVLHIVEEPGPDVALLAVEAKNGDGKSLPDPLKIASDRPAGDFKGKEVFVAGYPFYDYSLNNPDEVQRALFGDIYGVKRCAPGRLLTESGQQPSDMLYHDCSTLGGNSGSPVIELTENETPLVWGIHFQGSFEVRNWAWPMWKVAALEEVKKILAGP